jgi:hypothetical protein
MVSRLRHLTGSKPGQIFVFLAAVRYRQVNDIIGYTYVGVAVVIFVIGQLDVVPLIVIESPRHGACGERGVTGQRDCRAFVFESENLRLTACQNISSNIGKHYGTFP